MKRYHRWKKLAALLGICSVLGLMVAAPVQTQQVEQEGFRDVVELRRLMEVAREAGFSDEEMREITIEDDEGNIINVWKYLEEVERKKRLEAEKRKAQQEKIYLTVQDVFTELQKDEPDDLTRLRSKIQTRP
jgi:DNA-binding transcriptional MerR regulator